MKGLREAKKARIRESLIEHALRLFRQRGFDAVTVEEIAAAAEVSRRSFFRYFPSKESVLLARRHDQLKRFRALLAPGGGYAAVRAACLALTGEYLERRVQILRERAIVAASTTLFARDFELDRAFEAAIGSALGSGRRAKIAAAAVVGAIRVVLEEWALKKGKLDLRALGGEALDLVAPLAPAERPSRSVRG